MYKTRISRTLSTTAALALAITAFSAAPAFAESGSGGSLLRGQLVGSRPAPMSPVIAGMINPGGAPWVNGPSRIRVRANGRITVNIRGLVIPSPPGTGVNPVASVVATLVCGGMVQDSTEPFALSMAGNGHTSDMLSVSGHCDAPTVLIQPAANRTVYIASAMGEDEEDD